MIRHTVRQRCFGCERRGTRQVLIDGRSTWLCGQCPSPDEIKQRCRAIQDGWSAEEEAVRRFACPQELALERLAWRPPTCAVLESDP